MREFGADITLRYLPKSKRPGAGKNRSIYIKQQQRSIDCSHETSRGLLSPKTA